MKHDVLRLLSTWLTEHREDPPWKPSDDRTALKDEAERVGATVWAIPWENLPLEILDEFASGELRGSPYPAFAWHEQIYVARDIPWDGLAHEVAHAFEHRHYVANNPDKEADLSQFNWGIPPLGGARREFCACEVEVYLLEKHRIETFAACLDRHYQVGIIVNYDPEDEDEGPLAIEELEDAQRAGRVVYSSFPGVL